MNEILQSYTCREFGACYNLTLLICKITIFHNLVLNPTNDHFPARDIGRNKQLEETRDREQQTKVAVYSSIHYIGLNNLVTYQ